MRQKDTKRPRMSPFRFSRPRLFAYFLVEGSLICCVLYGLSVLTRTLKPYSGELEPTLCLAFVSLLFVLVLLGTGRNLGDSSVLFRGIVLFGVLSVGLGVLAYASIAVLFGQPKHFVALLVLEGAFAVPLAVGFFRFCFVKMRVFDLTRSRVLILGTGESARQVCRWVHGHHSDEYAVVGFADEDESRLGQIISGGARIQLAYSSIAQFSPGRVDSIIVALDEKRGKLPVRQLMEVRLLGIEIEEATTFFERVSGKISVETMLPSWLIYSEGFKTSTFRSFVKRIADLILSSILLLLTLPLMLFTALLVKFTSRGPILYRQERLGRTGTNFTLFKFRSMQEDAEQESGPTWARKGDPRVTPLGRLIRRIRIDELPQLLNIFKGHMSFVGPRPEREHFVRQLEKKIPYYRLRTTVRPGLTGWAQVEYGYGANDEDALEKLKYDLYYIKNNNMMLDLWIVLKTFKVVLTGRGVH
jgi:sugar transferase (PEP-CTERM system associated)